MDEQHDFLIQLFFFSDPPTILVDDPWVHAGETSTIMLKCRICATHPFAVSIVSIITFVVDSSELYFDVFIF